MANEDRKKKIKNNLDLTYKNKNIINIRPFI